MTAFIDFSGVKWAILGALIVALVAGAFLGGRMFSAADREKQAAEYGPAPSNTAPPPSAPALDYEEITGFDPDTQRRIDNREEIERLTRRVERLEIRLFGRSRGTVGPSGSAGELGKAPETENSEEE